MKEEHVTKAILSWLLDNNWRVICFDFPQSGTGRILHPNGGTGEKNKAAIIPDVVAVKNGVCIFMENKDRFYYPDYVKQHSLMGRNDYSDAISVLLKDHYADSIYYGVGLPTLKHKQASNRASHLVDFILCVDDDKKVRIAYNPINISFCESL